MDYQEPIDYFNNLLEEIMEQLYESIITRDETKIKINSYSYFMRKNCSSFFEIWPTVFESLSGSNHRSITGNNNTLELHKNAVKEYIENDIVNFFKKNPILYDELIGFTKKNIENKIFFCEELYDIDTNY